MGREAAKSSGSRSMVSRSGSMVQDGRGVDMVGGFGAWGLGLGNWVCNTWRDGNRIKIRAWAGGHFRLSFRRVWILTVDYEDEEQYPFCRDLL